MPIHKKGDTSYLHNYYTINLLSVMGKHYVSILLCFFKRIAIHHEPAMQGRAGKKQILYNKY